MKKNGRRSTPAADSGKSAARSKRKRNDDDTSSSDDTSEIAESHFPRKSTRLNSGRTGDRFDKSMSKSSKQSRESKKKSSKSMSKSSKKSRESKKKSGEALPKDVDSIAQGQQNQNEISASGRSSSRADSVLNVEADSATGARSTAWARAWRLRDDEIDYQRQMLLKRGFFATRPFRNAPMTMTMVCRPIGVFRQREYLRDGVFVDGVAVEDQELAVVAPPNYDLGTVIDEIDGENIANWNIQDVYTKILTPLSPSSSSSSSSLEAFHPMKTSNPRPPRVIRSLIDDFASLASQSKTLKEAHEKMDHSISESLNAMNKIGEALSATGFASSWLKQRSISNLETEELAADGTRSIVDTQNQIFAILGKRVRTIEAIHKNLAKELANFDENMGPLKDYARELEIESSQVRKVSIVSHVYFFSINAAIFPFFFVSSWRDCMKHSFGRRLPMMSMKGAKWRVRKAVTST
jgi:hypothetical protein